MNTQTHNNTRSPPHWSTLATAGEKKKKFFGREVVPSQELSRARLFSLFSVSTGNRTQLHFRTQWARAESGLRSGVTHARTTDEKSRRGKVGHWCCFCCSRQGGGGSLARREMESEATTFTTPSLCNSVFSSPLFSWWETLFGKIYSRTDTSSENGRRERNMSWCLTIRRHNKHKSHVISPECHHLAAKVRLERETSHRFLDVAPFLIARNRGYHIGEDRVKLNIPLRK